MSCFFIGFKSDHCLAFSVTKSISTVGTCWEAFESRSRSFPYQLLLVLTAMLLMSEQAKAICHCVKNDINNFHSMSDHFKKNFQIDTTTKGGEGDLGVKKVIRPIFLPFPTNLRRKLLPDPILIIALLGPSLSHSVSPHCET